MTTITQARDAIIGHFRSVWTADPVTTAIALHYDDVQAQRVDGTDGLPVEFARITVRHFIAETETLGANGKEQHEGQTVVQIFTPKGFGRARADLLAQIAKRAFQRQRIPGIDGWFFNVVALEIPAEGPRAQTNVVAPFRYSEVVA